MKNIAEGFPSLGGLRGLSPYYSGSFFGFVYSSVSMDMIFAVSAMLCPTFIEFEDHVFIIDEAFHFGCAEDVVLSTKYGSDRKTIERYANIICLSEFPNLIGYEAQVDDDFSPDLGKVLEHFWSRRLKEVFPCREFIFEIEKDMFDEDGWCLTFSQK